MSTKEYLLALFEKNLRKKGVRPGIIVKRITNSSKRSFYKIVNRVVNKQHKNFLEERKIQKEEKMLYVGIDLLENLVDERQIFLFAGCFTPFYYSYKFLLGEEVVYLPIRSSSNYLIDFFLNAEPVTQKETDEN